MQKTKKSVAKRFKLTVTGKMVRRTPGFRHLLGANHQGQTTRDARQTRGARARSGITPLSAVWSLVTAH